MISTKRVVVCVGSGGVGKTTTSAIVGIQEARRGKRVIVLTIDPAKRLANALGLDGLTAHPQRVNLPHCEGELSAMMLDMKTEFDRVVQRHAPADARAEILENRIYQYFSTSLAGTQEYAAGEAVYEIYQRGEYDLIVLDTPPTTHALDFLDASNRLSNAIDSKALQWLYKPTVFAGKKGIGIFSMGTSYVMKTLGKFTGTELLDQFATFLRVFSTMFEGLKTRGEAVRKLLMSDNSAFVVVTAPDPLTIEEASFVYKKLGRERAVVGGFVVNRVHDFGIDPEELARPAVTLIGSIPDGVADKRATAEKLVKNAHDYDTLRRADAEMVARLRQQIPDDVPIRRVPYFGSDIHNVEGLERARRAMFDEKDE